MSYANRVDSNSSEIVAAAEKIGATWIQQDRNAGFDILVLYRGKLHVVEIKHKSTKNRLTDNELVMRAECQLQGVDYVVICSVDEMVELLNEDVV
jgi:hypothetical protein